MINNQNSMKDVYSLTSIHFLMFLSQSIRFCLEKRVLVKLDFGRQVSPLGFIDLSNILFAHFSPNFRKDRSFTGVHNLYAADKIPMISQFYTRYWFMFFLYASYRSFTRNSWWSKKADFIFT